MKAYITTVATMAIIAAFADNFVPQKWQKYVSLLTGAVLLLTLISPLLKLRKIDIPRLETRENISAEYNIFNEVERDLKMRIEEDIKTRLSEDFKADVNAEVTLKTEDDTICGVEKITLDCEERNDITKLLKELYGCDNIQYKRR